MLTSSRQENNELNILESLHQTMQFPCVVVFRVIADASFKDALKLITAAIDEISGNSVLPITQPPVASRKGSYLSYKIPVKVASKQDMDRIYEDLGELPFVRHVL